MVFGYGLPVICAFLAWRDYAKHGWGVWPVIFLVVGVIVLLLTLFNREALKVVFKYWMKVAHAIGAVVMTVLLAGLFFIIFTPMAIVLRLMKKDFLLLQSRKETRSYWINRETKKQNYLEQF